jgi:hypothetical protein
MTEPALQLDEFALTELHVHWEPGSEGKSKPASKLDIGYTVHRLTSDPTKYRLTMTVKDHRAASEDGGRVKIVSTIVGFFTLPAATEAKEREKRIRLNGLTMLYGALRGVLSSVTGFLPPGSRYLLPTVNMLDVVRAVEGARAQAAAVNEEGPVRAPRPRRASPRQVPAGAAPRG